MDDRGHDGAGSPRSNRWRIAGVLLLVATAAGLGVLLIASGPPEQESEASAVLRTRVRAHDAADALRSPEVVRAIARATGVPIAGLRHDLSVTEADGFRLALRYRAGAAADARRVATESLRRVGSALLDDALTEADRALVAAQTDGAGVRAAERVAQDAREAREAPFGVRVETLTARPGWWMAGVATVVVLLLLTVTAGVLAARSRLPKGVRNRAPDVPDPPPPTAPAPVERAAPVLSLETLEQQLADLTRRAVSVAREEREVSV